TWLAGLVGIDPVWLGSGWIWLVLILAFVWMWLGFTVSLFRAALNSIERDPILSADVDEAPNYWSCIVRQWPTIDPVCCIVAVSVVVAAACIFELVLITAPPAMQYGVDVVSVRGWRLANVASDRGRPAMFALPFAVLLSLFALCV